jgi:hypothetical protein
MSKLPMESRPLRLAPEVRAWSRSAGPAERQEARAAQAAVLKVYQSGQQMTSEQWVEAYERPSSAAVGGERAAA